MSTRPRSQPHGGRDERAIRIGNASNFNSNSISQNVRTVDVADKPERQGGYIGFFLGSTPGFGVAGGGIGGFGDDLSGIGIQHLS
jgi:hypothetical protein